MKPRPAKWSIIYIGEKSGVEQGEITIGIISRFAEIMSVNIRSLLESSKQPEQAVKEYLRTLQMDLGALKAETAAVEAEEQRSRRALEECQAEISKLQRYAEKSVEAGEEQRALGFLEKKKLQSGKLAQLEAAYRQAAEHTLKLKQMELKLASDLTKLEAKNQELKEKLSEAEKINREQQKGRTSFDELEAKADQALNEALALAELKAGPKDFDKEFRAWEESMGLSNAETRSPQEELAALKDKQNN